MNTNIFSTMSRDELREFIAEYYPALQMAENELGRREAGISLDPETNELEDRLNLPLTEIRKVRGIGGRFYSMIYDVILENNPNQRPNIKLLCRLNWKIFKNHQAQQAKLFNYLVYELGIPSNYINCE